MWSEHVPQNVLFKLPWPIKEVLEKLLCVIRLEIAIDKNSLRVQDLLHKSAMFTEAIPVWHGNNGIPVQSGDV